MTRERTPLGRGDLGRDAERLDVLLGGRASSLPPEAGGDMFSKIVLYHGDGANAEFFDVNDSGLAASIAAVTGTDTIAIPPAADATFTSAITVPANTAVQGTGTQTTFISAKVTMSSNSFLRDVTVLIGADSADNLTGVAGSSDTGTTGYMNTVSIQITQAGAGDAYGVEMGGGDLFARSCFISGSSTGGTGNGVKSGAGDIFIEEGTAVQGSTAAVSGTNTFSIDSDKFIRLSDISNTNYNWIFTADNAGFAAAIAASATGDRIEIPTGTITLTAAHSITAGVSVVSLGNSILQATSDVGSPLITLGAGSFLGVKVVYSGADSAAERRAVQCVPGGTSVVATCSCTNAGTGDAIAIALTGTGVPSVAEVTATGIASGGGIGIGILSESTDGLLKRCHGIGEGASGSVGIKTKTATLINCEGSGDDLGLHTYTASSIVLDLSGYYYGDGVDVQVDASTTLSLFNTQYTTITENGTLGRVKGDKGWWEGASVYNNANISIGNAAWTNLTFNSEHYDSDSIHSTGANTNRLTCQTAGKYIVICNALWATSGAGVRYIRITHSVGGDIAFNSYVPAAGFGIGMNIVCTANMAIGDYVVVDVYQSSGGALNISRVVSSSPEVWIHRIA